MMRKVTAFLLSALFLAVSVHASEQLWHQLNEKAQSLSREKKYEEAVGAARQALQVAEETFGPKSLQASLNFGMLGEFYTALKKSKEAVEAYQNAIRIQDALYNHKVWKSFVLPYYLTSLNRLSDFHIQEGRFAEAEPLIKRELEIVEKLEGKDSPRAATYLNNLGYVYANLKKLDEAEKLYKVALDRWKKGKVPEYPYVAMALQGLANVYELRAAYTSSLKLYEEIYGIFVRNLGDAHPTVADLLEGMVRVYEKMGDHADAERIKARIKRIRSLKP